MASAYLTRKSEGTAQLLLLLAERGSISEAGLGPMSVLPTIHQLAWVVAKGAFVLHRSPLFTRGRYRSNVSKVRAAFVLADGRLLFLRTRFRRNHSRYAIVDAQLAVNLSGMLD